MNNCPLCSSTNVCLEDKISTQKIIGDYKKVFNIDVSTLIAKFENIDLYKCFECKYAFYLPSTVAGDDMFYEKLEKFPWYYMAYKWEHSIAEEYIKNDSKVLEVGCGNGFFLKKVIEEKRVIAEGLELNSLTVKKAKEMGLPIYLDTIENFSMFNKNKYDIVCSFQVLEHVPNPKTMIEASLKALKTGGLLIVGIPNNDSFIRKDLNPLLNMPPHHMGLFFENTLVSIEKLFKIKLEKIEIEPLQKYHLAYYVYLYVGQYLKKAGLIGKIVNKVCFIFSYPILRLIRKKIKGHTMVAIYRKI